jgi:plastocyanin
VVLTGRLAVLIALAAAAAMAEPPSAAAQASTTIQGRVDIQRVPSPVERRLSAMDASDPMVRETPREPRAVVYFESAPRGAFEDRDPRHATLDQQNETFVPHLLAITVGTIVDFPNSDRTYHNVFSLSKTKRFDLGRYAAGHSKSIVFDRPGIVRVFCDIHSHMNAFVLVFSHRFFAVTDTDGRYTIGGVPPGTYTLSAWYEGSVRDARTVTITGESRVAELDFTIR